MVMFVIAGWEPGQRCSGGFTAQTPCAITAMTKMSSALLRVIIGFSSVIDLVTYENSSYCPNVQFKFDGQFIDFS